MADIFARCAATGGQLEAMKPITINVVGIPAPGGSKKFVGFNPKTGRALIVDSGGKLTKAWRAAVAHSAQAVMYAQHKGAMLTGALRMEIVFRVPRAQWHRNSKGFLVPKAPSFPVTQPDTTKLLRSTEDAMTGIVWANDSAVVQQWNEKVFAGVGEAPGASITITCLEKQNNEPTTL